jgi:hypothetical protein
LQIESVPEKITPKTMKSYKKYILFVILGFLSLNLFSQPAIIAFSPGSGPAGSTVTITGTNFNTTPANNIVFFGTVRANVLTATISSLTVTVPAGAVYQPISVTVNRLTAWSDQQFVTSFAGGTSQFTPQSFEYATHVDSVNSNIETTKYTIGDIDNDGKMDIITIDRLNNTMSVYRNTSSSGSISFAAKLDFVTGQSPRSVNLADIDGDGKLDVIVTNLNDNTVSIFTNTTTGTNISFASKIDFATATQPAGIAIADLDKDGKPDLIINTVNLQGYVSVLRNISNGGTISFAPKTDLQATGGSIEDVKEADLDGDGKIDIIFPNYSLNVVTIFRNMSTAGNLSFAPGFNSGVFQSPIQIEQGDLNQDGKPDMIVGHYTSTNTPVFKNTSTPGNFVYQYMGFYTGGPTPTGLTINDLDGDGKPDFAMTNGLESFSLFKNTSTAGGGIAFTSGTTIPALYNSEVRSADFDGDGLADLAFNTGILRVTIWRNRAAYAQIYSITPASGKTGDTITIQGANFSGITSVSFGGVAASSFLVVDPTTIKAVVANGTTGDVVAKTSNDSAHISGFTYLGPPVLTSFSPAFGGTGDTILITGINFLDFDTVRFGGTPAAIFFNTAPGVIKAVVGAGSSGNVSVTNFYGSGALPGFTYYPVPAITSFTPVSGPAGTSLTITGTDFNTVSAVSVGGLPVVSYNVSSPTTITAIVAEGVTGRIRVTTPGGTGISSSVFSFPKPSITSFTPSTGTPGSIVTIQGSNFISDTASDIVFFGASRASVISATPNSLTVIVPPGVTYQPVSVTLNGYTIFSDKPFIQTFQDFNGGITPTTFTQKGAFNTNGDNTNNFIVDIDGDGKPDIVVIAGTLSVLRNLSEQGSPSFAPGVDIASGWGSYTAISIGDINSDGKPDIAVVNMGGEVVVLKNTSTIGNISFERQTISINADPTDITLQDFDGDGKVDLAVCSNNYLGTMGNVFIFPNIGTEGNIAFGQIDSISLTGTSLEIKSADFDNDGKPDIILANGDGVTILKNLGSPGNLSFDAPVHFTAINYAGYFYYCLGDFDGDGFTDVAASVDSNVYVFHNTTSNNIISFDSKLAYASHQVTESIVTGQLDGDGKPDLIVVGEKKIFAFRNESTAGAISFAAPVNYFPRLSYNWTDNAAIGDLDGDGKSDIALAIGADQKIAVFRNGIGETVDSVCANTDTSIVSNISGSNYQWQINAGAGFNNITDDSVNQGASTATLQIHHMPVGYNGFQFRCLVDGNAGNTTNMVVTPNVLPHGTASSPAMVCADSVFSIQFTATNDIPLTSSIEIWEKADSNSFVLIATQPYNGNPLEYPVTVNAASIRTYFFRIIPPSTILCGLPNNSDTVSTLITQLLAPIIDTAGYTMTIDNPHAGASYTWQVQSTGGIWNNVVPTDNGISYTANVSGVYRVMGILNGCMQYSSGQNIVIAPVPNNSPATKVYPNPASGQITVEHPASGAGASIRLFDMMGRMVKLVMVVENSTETIIGVEDLSPGTFKLIWSDGKDSFARTLLISK